MSADITEERIAEIRERLEKESLTHDTLEPKDYFAKMCGRLLNALLSARSQLTALQSVPQGVEVPEIMDELLTALEHLLEDTQHRDHDCGDEWCPVDVARRVVAKARLVPTPPQADAVMVPRSAAEYAIRAFDWIECPDPEHYEALRAFHDALRTSAQDHNGEGAK